jgi:SET domain
MRDDEDPFGVFGDEDDEDDSDRDDTVEVGESFSSSNLAKSLMAKANAKLQSQHESLNPDVPGRTHSSSRQESDPLDLSTLERLELDWPRPAYLGPMVLVSLMGVGGGRGYVAAQNLEPGTLVLVEEPAMPWPQEQLGRPLGLISIRHLILEHPALVQSMEFFHPTKEDVDHHAYEDDKREQIGRMFEVLQSEDDPPLQEEQIQQLVTLARERDVTSRNGSALNALDILRLFLALRYNGLETGVYRHVAMLNHDCHPNCAKLLPQDNQLYSEVRTTRPVLAGESLTISYVPRIMSHASRRKYLWEQHRFDIGADIGKSFLKMELVGNGLPRSHIHRWEDDSIVHRVETSTAELEKMLDDLQDDIKSNSTNADTWETLKALEQSSLELYRESVLQLKSNEHILLNSVLLIHVEACEQLRKAPMLPLSVQVGILARQVESLHRLIPLQTANLGKDHFDVARTHLDLATGISELLSRSPTSLYVLNLPSLKAFEQWSALAGHCRREHQRIKELYPHDAEEYIGKTLGIV